MLTPAATPNTQGDFVQQFLQKLPIEMRQGRRFGPEEPEAVFRGALQLTKDQERRLVDHCLLRKKQLELELGRDQISVPDWWRQTAGQSANNLEDGVYRTFFGRIALWDMLWHGQMQWRKYAYGANSIFNAANQHVPLCRNMAQEYVAEAQNSIFGTAPWMGLSAIGMDDTQRRTVIEKFIRLGFEEAQIERVLKQAIELAVNRGHVILKPIWSEKKSYYQDWLSVGLDTDGEPLRAMDGDWIKEDDTWLQQDNEGGEMDGTTWTLARDQQTPLPDYAVEPDEIVFDRRLLDRENIEYQGLEITIPRYMDVLAPLNTPSLDDADIVIHNVDRPMIEVLNTYLEFLKRTGQSEQLQDMIDYLQQRAGGSHTPESHQWALRPELGEAGGSVRSGNSQSIRDFIPFDRAVLRTAECWVTYPVYDDGQLRKLFVQIDIDSRRVITYDFQERVVPPNTGRPFPVLRINPVDGRWHGASLHEVLWPLNFQVDVAINKIHNANQTSGALNFINSTRIVEAEGAQNPMRFTPQPGNLYHINGDFDPQRVFASLPVVTYDQEVLFKVAEFSQQMIVNLSAAAGPNDDRAAGLQSSELATGILHMEEMRKRNFVPILSCLREGLEDCCYNSAMLLLQHVDDNLDALAYFDGDQAALEVLHSVTPLTFRFNLRLLLSRHRRFEKLMQNAAVKQTISWYASMDPIGRQIMRQLAEEDLESYDSPELVAILDLIDTIPQPMMLPPPPPPAGQETTQTKGGNMNQQLANQLST
jgi:hypothetical protein